MGGSQRVFEVDGSLGGSLSMVIQRLELRRLLIIFRPLLVRIRARNPLFRTRLILLLRRFSINSSYVNLFNFLLNSLVGWGLTPRVFLNTYKS